MVNIRHATAADSDALINLSALTPMKGRISLRIDRNPDFFQLLRERGTYIAFVAETEKKEIVGSFTAACQTFFIEQTEVPVYYLGDLKVHPQYTGSSLAYRIVQKMYAELKAGGADLLYCNTVKGNDSVMPFFGGRAGIPEFKNICRFHLYQVLPRRSRGQNTDTTESYNLEELELFYKNFYSRYGFFPDIKQLASCTHFIRKENGKILAALSVADTASFKQNVLISYPVGIGILLGIFRILRPLLSLPRIPQKNLPLNILYVKFYGGAKFSDQALEGLIGQARHFAYENNYHFLSIAVDEKDERMNRLMKKWKLFVFNSNGLLTSLKDQTGLITRISTAISYEDFSLV